MSSLVRKTLLREWPRFVPAALAICFTGVLLIVQTALVLGIFGSAAIYVNASSADLWIGYPGTQSVNLGRNIQSDVEMALRMQPGIRAVEPLLWHEGDWRQRPENSGVSIYMIGIDTAAQGMAFQRLLTPEQRWRLQQPDSVIVDRADLDQLGVGIGDSAWVDGRRMTVVGVTQGMRALGGVNVLASLDTVRNFDSDPASRQRATYLLASGDGSVSADALRQQMRPRAGFGPYAIWTASEFARQSQLFWMFDTGAGVAVLFLAIIVMLVGAVISSQALMAVVMGSVREYATLNALGVGMRSLRLIVLEQATWIGGIGAVLALLLSALLLALAGSRDVPVDMNLQAALACCALLLLLALTSGLLAMRALIHAEPALLLH